ncbi:MAG TPA: fumarylacetoacetate hydrolase family protein [Verrucomicrobiota bacterium]|nr:fumarylacetoacetate hydrolase family protein [Verrucomicrobiota bacterium]
MKLCRFVREGVFGGTPEVRTGVFTDDESEVADLAAAGHPSLADLLNDEAALANLAKPGVVASLPRLPIRSVLLVAPVERQEVWAAGVTYLRSKSARMEESDFSATAYDRVYDAPRPELFFKSLAEKVSGPGAPVGIRSDARWNVPEPELALVLNRAGKVVGYTAGNDMSSRDIEGENLLYLPQAKIYRQSCALGPVITVGVSEAEVRTWTISIQIERAGAEVFRGETPVAKIKRGFDELAGWLTRSQEFPHGVVLLTGTGVVPPNEFTLASGDVVRIRISGVGELVNQVVVV